MTPPLIMLIWIAGIITGAFIGFCLGSHLEQRKQQKEAQRQTLQVLRDARDTELAALRKMTGLS